MISYNESSKEYFLASLADFLSVRGLSTCGKIKLSLLTYAYDATELKIENQSFSTRFTTAYIARRYQGQEKILTLRGPR